MDVPDNIKTRFGPPNQYEQAFLKLGCNDTDKEFDKLHESRFINKQVDVYEYSRQEFLKLLGQRRMVWQPTNEQHDLNVDIARIYHKDKYYYIAYMRIQPRGFRAERIVPPNNEIHFHLVYGRVIFSYKRKPRTLVKGSYITVAQNTTYSIRCLSSDQPALLVFKIVDRNHSQHPASKKPAKIKPPTNKENDVICID